MISSLRFPVCSEAGIQAYIQVQFLLPTRSQESSPSENEKGVRDTRMISWFSCMKYVRLRASETKVTKQAVALITLRVKKGVF